MQQPRNHPHTAPRALLLAPLAAVLLGACTHRSSHRAPRIPVFVERESNDNEFTANYFGVVRPGDRFVVQGRITDIPFDPFDPFNGFDPFDGFAFTTSQPVHVEFSLLALDPADLDLCVYDPQIGLDVACYQTPFNPEVGAIDVFAGNYDFHLVVESFSGISDYDLEVRVFSLYPATAGGGATAAGATIQASASENFPLAPSAAGRARAEEPLAGYRDAGRPAREEPARVLRRAWAVELDPATGATESVELELFSDGTWMGKRHEEPE